MRALRLLVANFIPLFARLVTAVRGIWDGVEPVAAQRVYYANHCSNADFVLIWTVLPPQLRRQTRPVAAADYWLTSPLRRFIGQEVFNAVLIDRRPDADRADPLDQICAALADGASLIIFPEGTRNTTEDRLLPFKSGIYNISRRFPGVELVPTWIENLNYVMPKGKILPIPLLCTVTFGAPVRAKVDEAKDAFLARASDALLAVAPTENGA